MSRLHGLAYEVTWWREGNLEVDYVVRSGRDLWAVEVKSGRERSKAGLEAFRARHPRSRQLLVGGGGLALEEFLAADPAALLRSL